LWVGSGLIEASEPDEPEEEQGDCQEEHPEGSFGNGQNDAQHHENGKTDKDA
jgi:hypothetical protein